jgi:murein DD-endopeptidase MepM/ murein hydrolase activator NlpD
MADESVLNNIDGLNKSLKKTEATLKGISDLLGNISKGFGGMSTSGGGNSGGVGQKQLGVASGGGIMDNSLGSFSSVGAIMGGARKATLFSGLTQAFTGAATGVAAGITQGLPDVGLTTQRSTGYYNASLYGGTNMTKLGLAGFSAMRGGIQSAGMDGAVANSLAAQGVMPSTQAGSQFMNMMKATGNITQFTNMGNMQGAQAMAGLHTGSMSANLMRNFGIFTTDPTTGKQFSSSQILGQMQDRMTMGGTIKLTQAQLMQQRQSGALGQNLQNSGLSQDQQDLLFQGMMYTSKTGKTVDWADKKQVAELAAANGNAANRNPMASQYAVATAQTGSQQAAMNSYITGMDTAAKAVGKFESAITHFLSTPAGKIMAGTNAGAQLAMTDGAVQGAVTAGSGLLGGAMQVGNTLMTNRMLKNLTGGAGAAAKAAGGGASILPKLAKGFGIGAIAGLAAEPIGNAIRDSGGNTKTSNQWGGATQGALTGAGFGAMVGSVIPGLGTAVGAGIGAAVGGGIGFFSGGESSTINSGNTTDTSGAIKLVAPVKGPITCKFGVVDKLHPNGHHGVDYGVPIGTPVQASADGTVYSVTSGGKDFGTKVEIDHGGGYRTLYGHLSQANVTTGQSVKQGQVIALSGNTGRSSGPHVHFGLLKNGSPVNPSLLGLSGSVAIVAGNVNDTASNSAGGGYTISGGGGGGGDLTGYSTGSSDVKLPASYSGAAIASQAVSVGSMGSGVNGQSAAQSGSMPGISTGGAGGDGGPSLSGGGNTVNINLTIPNASASEARKLAAMVKDYLENDKLTSSMGRL